MVRACTNYYILEHMFNLLVIPVQVGFDPVDYNVTEVDGVVNLIIRRFTPSPLPVTVIFNTMDGTAVGMCMTSSCVCECQGLSMCVTDLHPPQPFHSHYNTYML